jgi:hypothetical protein
MVRADAILKAQDDQVTRDIVAPLAPYCRSDHYGVPVSFLVVSGTNPHNEEEDV